MPDGLEVRSRIPGLPKGKRTTLFRGVEKVLLNSTLLQCVKTRQSFAGEPTDAAPPSPDQCPWMRISLVPVPVHREAESFNRVPVPMLIELATQGSCQDDIVDLWEAVEDSLASNAPAPGGTNVQVYLRQLIWNVPTRQFTAGANDFQFSDPAFSSVMTDQDVITMWRGAGVFNMYTFKPA